MNVAISYFIAPGMSIKYRNLNKNTKDHAAEWRNSEHVQKAIEKHTGYTVEQLRKKNRKRSIIYAKKYFIWFLWKRTTLNKSDIGKLLNMDHATVLWHLSDLQDLMDTNIHIQNDVAYLGDRIKSIK